MKQFILVLVLLVMAFPKSAYCEESADTRAVSHPDAAELLRVGLAQATKEQKRLFLSFGGSYDLCELFDNYHADPQVQRILRKYFVLVKIDIANTYGGEDLYMKFGDRGLPAWNILDGNAKILSDSADTGTNVGFPLQPAEVAHYFEAIERAGVKLSDTERELLATKLKEAEHPKIYDEKADGAKQIAAALSLAKKDHKQVLLQFGANWCPWCRRLHNLMENDPTITAKLEANYIVVLIDVNETHNDSIDSKYGNPTRLGLPAIVILDADGRLLATEGSKDFAEGDYHNPEKVLAFLNDRKFLR